MSGVKASFVAWPEGTAKESVPQPIRLTLEAPGGMFPRADDPEMVEILTTFGRGISRLVKKRTGVELQWGMEGKSA